MDTTIVLNGCAVVTVDGARTEHDTGHVIVEGGRISAVAAGPPPAISPAPGTSTPPGAWPRPAW